MRENKTCLDQGWRKMPTEYLDRILQAELEKAHPNEEVVLPILCELEEREKNLTVEEMPEVLEILEKLKKHETSSKRTKAKRKRIAGIAAVAAAACIVIMAWPRTVGAESIFDVLARWTESVFEFFTPEQDASNPPVEQFFETDNAGLQQLYDRVTELGVTEPVVPMWLPEGFELSEVKELPIHNECNVNAKFANGSNYISITYRISTDIIAKIEKEDSAVEVYTYAGTSYFILDNDKNFSVTWIIDGVECLLSTDTSREDSYEIIKSIYRGEL